MKTTSPAEISAKFSHSFYAQLGAMIKFTDNEFNIICEHADHHYDSTVKSLTKLGGFLYGRKGRRDFAKTQLPNEDYLDWETGEYESRHIQLMLKAIEFTHSDEAAKLYYRIKSIASEMRAKQNDVNTTLNPENNKSGLDSKINWENSDSVKDGYKASPLLLDEHGQFPFIDNPKYGNWISQPIINPENK